MKPIIMGIIIGVLIGMVGSPSITISDQTFCQTLK